MRVPWTEHFFQEEGGSTKENPTSIVDTLQPLQLRPASVDGGWGTL